jgi:purine-binding chemotaxis protein CheW
MSNAAQKIAETAAGQYLSFRLGAEEYALDILTVQEIRGYSPLTQIPRSEPWVLGVLNLRGAIVPVMDLRQRLGLEKREPDDASVVIVLAVNGGGSRRVFGMLVDGVTDVIDLGAERLRPAPDLGDGARTFLSGMAAVGERTLIVVDAARLSAGVAGVPLP